MSHLSARLAGDMRIVRGPEAELAPALRAQVLTLQDQAWPGDPGPESSQTHDPLLQPVSLLLLHEDDTVVAALDVLTKTIFHSGARYTASGLSTVVTAPAHRSRGYGHRLVVAAREYIGSSGADIGIFTCDPPLAGFYERAGWTVLTGTVIVGGSPARPFPSDELGKVTMGSFFSTKARSNAADFVGSRIELFPGEIDRLW